MSSTAESRWLSHSERIIAEVLAGIPLHHDERSVRQALRRHYPFGQRKYHPYKQWCKAVRNALIQRGLIEGKKPIPRFAGDGLFEEVAHA